MPVAGTRIELYGGPLDGERVLRTAEDFVAIAYGSAAISLGIAVYKVVTTTRCFGCPRTYGVFVFTRSDDDR